MALYTSLANYSGLEAKWQSHGRLDNPHVISKIAAIPTEQLIKNVNKIPKQFITLQGLEFIHEHNIARYLVPTSGWSILLCSLTEMLGMETL